MIEIQLENPASFGDPLQHALVFLQSNMSSKHDVFPLLISSLDCLLKARPVINIKSFLSPIAKATGRPAPLQEFGVKAAIDARLPTIFDCLR